MALKDSFRENLRLRLELGGITVTQLAEDAGVNRVTIYKILNGDMEPSLSVCEAVAKAAGMSPPEKIFQKTRPRAV